MIDIILTGDTVKAIRDIPEKGIKKGVIGKVIGITISKCIAFLYIQLENGTHVEFSNEYYWDKVSS